MKKKVLGIFNDYKKEFLKYLKQIKYFFSKIKTNLLKKENRKRNLTILGLLAVVNLLVFNIYNSYGHYNTKGIFSIMRALVGKDYKKEYDYVLLVYLKDDTTSDDEYYLANQIPSTGYIFSGYNCQNNSTLIYDTETKLTSVTTDKKEICSIYFDAVAKSDLSVKILLEDRYESNNFISSEIIPAFGYTYSHYECTNYSALEYNNELHKVKIKAKENDSCNIYFKRLKADVTITLYVEENYQKEDYLQKENIPSDISYTLNEDKSYCINANEERIDTTITYVDGYINVEVEEVSNCEVYLDKNEE